MIHVNKIDSPPERGQNPEPEGGWPWSLTDYELAYIREFNARPVREGWTGTDRDEDRLDDEAEGIRANRPAAAREHRTIRRSVVLSVSGALLAVALASGGLGLANMLTALATEATTLELLQVSK